MKTTAIAVITLLILSFTAEAQNLRTKDSKPFYTKQGTFEIGGDIFFTSTTYITERGGTYPYSTDGTVTNFSINGSAGVFAVNGLKLSIEPVLEIESYDSDNSRTWFKIYFTPEYVFNTKTIFYPYFGGSLGYTSLAFSNSIGYSNTQSGLSYGLKGGWKINAFGNCLFNFGAKYYRETYNYSDTYSDVKQHHNLFGVTAGVSVFFK
jgi:outer membrane protein